MTSHVETPHGELTVDDDGIATLRSGPFTLEGGTPTVDGKSINWDRVSHAVTEAGGFEVTYAASDVSFRLRARRHEDHTLELQLALHGFEPGRTFGAFGFRFTSVSGAQRAFRQGFYSWDGSEIFDLGARMASLDPLDTHLGFSPQASHSVTALLDDRHTTVIGTTEAKRMPQTFLIAADPAGRVSLDLTFGWEHASTAGLDELASEPLRVIHGDDTEHTLRAWAQVFGEQMGGGRIADDPMRGWCSWYYHYYFATEQDIEENLAGAIAARDELGIPLDVFMIDANHFAQLGDWLDTNPRYYPNGQRRLIEKIKAAGFTPGLWIAPYWVTNRSRLAQEHPDWLVQDPDGGPLVIGRYYGEEKIWCYPVEETYVLDTSHPDALSSLLDVIATWREWGVEYFKTDFMYQGAVPGARHDTTKNRIEIWRDTAEAIRDAMGDAYWSGCGQPIFPSVGLVDANRISGDVGPVWNGRLSQESMLRDTLNRHYMHNVFWQNDPDCVLVRDFHHELTDTEVEGLGIYVGMSGGLCLTSDPLHLISAERRDFLKFLTPGETSTPRAPLMGRDIANLQCFVNDRPGDTHIAFFLNSGEERIERSLPLSELGLAPLLHALDWNTGAELGPIEELAIDLAPHHSRLVYLTAEPLDGWRPEHLLDQPS